MQIPTYPNISWIHQLVSAGFRYPEYEPNVEHFLEVLEPFFSITVEEAGCMFQAPRLWVYQIKFTVTICCGCPRSGHRKVLEALVRYEKAGVKVGDQIWFRFCLGKLSKIHQNPMFRSFFDSSL